MPLPAQPDIQLLAPQKLVAGRDAKITVVLTSPRPTPLEYVDLIISGQRFWAGQRHETLRLGARLAAPRRLPKGSTELHCRVPLPEGAYPTFAGSIVDQRYEAHVHASIPYWPDARASFALTVRPPERPPLTDDTLLFSSRAGGSGPYAEVSLGTRGVAPGDVLRGAVALFNVAAVGYARVTVSLVEIENDHPGKRWAIELAPPRFVEGERIDFALKVPELGPSHALGGFRVQHRLEVTAHGSFRELLVLPIPIDVLPFSTGAGPAPVIHALGDERITRLFREVALERGAAFEDGALVHRAGEVAARVRRDVRRDVPRLAIELEHPPLGLGLRSERRRGLRRMLPGGLRSGWTGLDDELLTQARSEAQGERWLRLLAGALAAVLPPSITVERLDDQALTLASADAGTSREGIAAALEAARVAAGALAPLLDRVPLPLALDPVADAWPALARQLGATLDRGTGTLARRDAGSRLEVRLVGERDALEAVRVALAPEMLALPALRAEDAEAFRPFGEEAVRIAGALLWPGLGQAHDLFASDGELVLTARTDALAPDAPTQIERILRDLSRLAEALRGQAGPFR